MGTTATVGSRKPLDDSLKDGFADLLVLCGLPGSEAEMVYQAMKATPSSWDDWQHIFFIRDPSQLTTQEKQAWFGASPLDRYVVLRSPDDPKKIAQRGRAADLMTDGAPDILKIVAAFLA